MVKLKNYTDDQIIEYLMDECDPETREELSRAIELDAETAERHATLKILYDQLRLLPAETFFNNKKPVSPLSMIVKTAVLVGIFFTGVILQSEFSILQKDQDLPVVIESNVSGDFPYQPTIVM